MRFTLTDWLSALRMVAAKRYPEMEPQEALHKVGYSVG